MHNRHMTKIGWGLAVFSALDTRLDFNGRDLPIAGRKGGGGVDGDFNAQ